VVNKKKETYNKWIKAAYEEFAEDGPNFSLKALSSKESLSRTTLYYHFSDREDLIDELIHYHTLAIEGIIKELRNMRVLIPDLYELLYQHNINLKFHKQLFNNSHIVSFNELYHYGNDEIIKCLVPYVKAYYKLKYSDKEIFNFYSTLTDAWYAKLDFTNLSVKSMIELAEEIMDNILRLSNNLDH
jgi:AcrR family transcriptional regulator